MNPAAASSATGLPASAAPTEPAWVRHGSAAVQRDYAEGLEFEQLLASQLAGTLTATAGLGVEGGEPEEGGAAGGGVVSSMLSQALTTGVTHGGGLGLAAELARDMEGATGTGAPPSAPAVTGGVRA